ncbi:unnamed protein product [Caretta caretta]
MFFTVFGLVYTGGVFRSKLRNFSYMNNVAEVDVLRSTYRGVFTVRRLLPSGPCRLRRQGAAPELGSCRALPSLAAALRLVGGPPPAVLASRRPGRLLPQPGRGWLLRRGSTMCSFEIRMHRSQLSPRRLV